ncbi:response regulator [Streptomyces cucumeris]|uniref:response regulator n=1 Tax=Streptomyces cucumeris TaxID=2962890 RepID=UPI003D72BFF7
MTVPEANETRILLADDHALVRRGVRLILESEPDLTVVAEAVDGAEAVEAARAHRPDLAILDIAMPRLTGLQAARELSRIQPGTRVLILTMYDNEPYFFEALAAGASGYVLKSVADRDLVEACRATMRGDPFLYPGAVNALIRNYLHRAGEGEDIPERAVTEREEVALTFAAAVTTRGAGGGSRHPNGPPRLAARSLRRGGHRSHGHRSGDGRSPELSAVCLSRSGGRS